MPWDKPQPLQSWTPQQQAAWQSEVWARTKFFQFDWTPPLIPATFLFNFFMASVMPADILSNACIGLRIGMGLKLTSPALPARGLVWDCTVEANDTATIWIQNFGPFDQTPPAGLWTLSGVIV